MYRTDENGSKQESYSGYAGIGKGYNNPSQDGTKNVGPLPAGDYTIGKQEDHGDKKTSMNLMPDKGNDMKKRDSFMIHGAHDNDQKDSSNGCIVLDKKSRDKVGASEDTSLHVVPGSQNQGAGGTARSNGNGGVGSAPQQPPPPPKKPDLPVG